MNKIQQSRDDLRKQLDEQLELLSKLAELYDTGSTIAAKSMATSIRLLLHDTRNSQSLLGQLDLKASKKFYDTAETREKLPPGSSWAGSFSALLGVAFGGTKEGYVPHFDDVRGGAKMVDFDEYWNKEIFVDHKINIFTRQDIVLYLANQDGGSHVDPGLDKKYAALSRHNSLGWKVSRGGKKWEDLNGAELASVRQIAHEILKTLVRDYETPKSQNSGAVMGAGGIILHTAETNPHTGIKRKDPCPCGSGKKFKRCHGV